MLLTTRMDFTQTAQDEGLLTQEELLAFSAARAMLDAGSQESLYQAACTFADIVGRPKQFVTYLGNASPSYFENIEKILKLFRENVELLINKTWVEDDDDNHKYKLREEIISFEEDFRCGDSAKALRRFISLSNDLAHLLFGNQSNAPDFLEYSFRIDSKLGLFFWYIKELEEQLRKLQKNDSHIKQEKLFYIESLLGIYCLATF